MQPLADWRPGRIRGEAECELRYRGQAHELTVPVAPRASLAERFHARHRERFGFADPGRRDRGGERARLASDGRPGARAAPGPAGGAGARPGVGGAGRRDDVGRRGVDGAAAAGRLVEDGAVIDPAGLQVLAAALRGVAEEMGAALVRSAHSANIKERRDCSTAVFDPGGRMIAQAEHLPVHLGAMPDAVAAVLARGARRGEVWALNDPYTGGTHLPDITLVAVVDDLGIVCSRAHHADVGGMQPASMPAGATELLQEGVVIPPLRLTGDVRALLVANMRKPAERLADLRAQEACMAVGADRLRQLAARFGRTTLLHGMDELHAYSERRIRAAIDRIPDGVYEAEDTIEGDGIHVRDIPIRVRVTVAGDRVRGRLRGHGAAAAGERQLPDRSHALGGLLLRPVGLRSRHPGVGRRVRRRSRWSRRRAAS